MSDWNPVCPYARAIGGVDAATAGVVCGAMEADQARADPILEGAPVGVVIRAVDNSSTLANLCCGQGEPVADPDDLRAREYGQGHYTACPIWCASKEITAMERLFGEDEAPVGDEDGAYTAPGVSVGPQALTDAERAALGLGG